MNKRITIFCAALAILLIIIAIEGKYQRQVDVKHYDSTEMLILNADDISCIQTVSSIVTTRNTDITDVQNEVNRFACWLGTFKPNQMQREIVLSLFADGADLRDLYAICRFWEDTDADFSMIREIWANHPTEGKADDPIVWIENAYNVLVGKTDDALNVDEVRAYLSAGLTYDDIMAANRLSRKREIRIRDILEQIQNGSSWEEIILPTADVHVSALTKQYSPCELLDGIIIARKMGCAASDVFAEVAKERNNDDDIELREWYETKWQEAVQHDLRIADVQTFTQERGAAE